MGTVNPIDATEVSEMEPPEVQETFHALSSGDSVRVVAWGGGDEYVEYEGSVKGSQFSQDETDDIVRLDNGMSLKLKWLPAEPNVGIERPYPEPPIHFVADQTYDVIRLERR